MLLAPTKNSLAATTLLTAADILRKRGWCQRVSESIDRRLCIRGSIAYAESGKRRRNAAERLVLAHLGLERPHQLDDWNDDYARTVADVIGALEGAAVVPSK